MKERTGITTMIVKNEDGSSTTRVYSINKYYEAPTAKSQIRPQRTCCLWNEGKLLEERRQRGRF